ncbi:MAG: TraR/DksA family transcriptional regulator [Sciscionella sp.]
MARHPMLDVPARRTAPAADGRLSAYLPAFRRTLEEHLAFRRQQLADLHSGYSAEAGSGRRSIAVMVAASAGQALTDIEAALARMEIGSFGLCTGCGGEIPLQLLQAIPQTARCLSCHRERETRR